MWPRAGTAAPHSPPSSPSSSWPAVRRSYSTCSTAAPGTAAPHSPPSSPSSSWPAVRRSYSTCSTAAPGQLSGAPTFRVCSTTAAQLLLVSCLSLLIHLERSCPCPAVRCSNSRCCTAAPGQLSGAPTFHVAQLQLSGALTPRVAQMSPPNRLAAVSWDGAGKLDMPFMQNN